MPNCDYVGDVLGKIEGKLDQGTFNTLTTLLEETPNTEILAQNLSYIAEYPNCAKLFKLIAFSERPMQLSQDFVYIAGLKGGQELIKLAAELDNPMVFAETLRNNERYLTHSNDPILVAKKLIAMIKVAALDVTRYAKEWMCAVIRASNQPLELVQALTDVVKLGWLDSVARSKHPVELVMALHIVMTLCDPDSKELGKKSGLLELVVQSKEPLYFAHTLRQIVEQQKNKLVGLDLLAFIAEAPRPERVAHLFLRKLRNASKETAVQAVRPVVQHILQNKRATGEMSNLWLLAEKAGISIGTQTVSEVQAKASRSFFQWSKSVLSNCWKKLCALINVFRHGRNKAKPVYVAQMSSGCKVGPVTYIPRPQPELFIAQMIAEENARTAANARARNIPWSMGFFGRPQPANIPLEPAIRDCDTAKYQKAASIT